MRKSYAVCHKHSDVALDHVLGSIVHVRDVTKEVGDMTFTCHCGEEAAYFLLEVDMDRAVTEYVEKMSREVGSE